MECEAFEAAVAEHGDRVHAYARMMLRDPEEARDVAQDALIRLWRHRASVQAEAARSWLMRTAHNLCIDRLRRRTVRSEVDHGDEVAERRPAGDPGPDRLAESGQMGRLLNRALEALSPTDRAVVVMREVQGLPYDEIAAALEIPLGTLKARLHRARERLRQRLVRAGATP